MEELPLAQAVLDRDGNTNIIIQVSENVEGWGSAFPCDCRSQLTLAFEKQLRKEE